MAKHPHLESIEQLLSENSNFTLTSTQYEKETGTTLPKGDYYLKKKSAVAKIAEKFGYRIETKERTIEFIKER